MNVGIFLLIIALVLGVALAMIDVEAKVKKVVTIGAVVLAIAGIAFILLGLVGRLGV